MKIRKAMSSEETVKEVRTHLDTGLRIYLRALVFISGAHGGTQLYGDACGAR